MSATVSGRKPILYNALRVGELEHIASNIDVFLQAGTWIRNYLAKPHAKLGRSGTVCPFAPPALAQDKFRIALVRLTDDNKRAQILNAIEYHLHAFLSSEGSYEERVLHATVILFPDVSLEEAPELIDGTKEELKASFIERGLMLGEFHALNESPGLHNPEFRPLRSPIPMLAIRHIVATDVVFLNRPEYDVETRLKYLESYLAVPSIARSSREEVERAAVSLRAQIRGCKN